MKIHILKQKILAAAAAKKQSFFKALSVALAAALVLNLVPLALISEVSAETASGLFEDETSSPDMLAAELSGFADLPDSAEQEKMYTDELFYGQQASAYKDYGTINLTGEQHEIYEWLSYGIEKVANGKSTSTVITYYLSTPYYSLDSLRNDIDAAVYYLLADIPQSFYWFDETAGYQWGAVNKGTADNEIYNEISVAFAVLSSYADTNGAVEEWPSNNGTGNARTVYLTTDASKTTAAKYAMEAARDITEAVEYESYYDKILSFKEEICDLAEYDQDAANNDDTPYSDNWPLVYVFDEDPYTNVDCEGYSKAFQYLCDLSGIECYTVTGTLTDSNGSVRHMWNIVVLGCRSYLVDLTNCDEGRIGYPDLLLLKGASVSDETGCKFSSIGLTYTYDKDTLDRYKNAGILTVSTKDFDPAAHNSNHKVCQGAESCPDCTHKEIKWIPWESDNSLPTKTGNYYLTKDVYIGRDDYDEHKGYTVSAGNDIKLCLNGKTVISDDSAEVRFTFDDEDVVMYVDIVIESGASFSLCDCVGGSRLSTNGGDTACVNKGSFNLYNGTIVNDYYRADGIYNIAQFTMAGGSIDMNRGVFNEHGGTFDMYGGTIENDPEDRRGTGVFNEYGSTFTMHGGTIVNNPDYGVINKYGSTFTMHDGIIANNYDGVVNKFDCTFTMYGGEITANWGNGNVVNNDECTFDMHGGEIANSMFGVDNGDYSIFTMHSGEIINNSVGVGNGYESIFTMHDGKIANSDHCGVESGYSNSVFTMNGGSIENSEFSGVVACGTFTMNDGTIANNMDCGVSASGTFTMNDGTIANNNYCGVSANGTFTMNGGTIKNNGCGVENNNIFDMYGGSIAENTTNGVYNCGETFTMYGGSIDNNGENGVYNESKYGIFVMKGGNIENNVEYGIFNEEYRSRWDCRVKILGGKISKNGIGCYMGYTICTVGGAVVIDSNITSNVYLEYNAFIAVDPDNPLEDGAYIGVTTGNPPEEDWPINLTEEPCADYIAYFHSDDPAYEIKCSEEDGEEGILQLVLIDIFQRHTVCAGEESCPDDLHEYHSVEKWTPWDSDTELPDESGYYFLTKDVTLSEVYTVTEDINLCLNGKTVTGGIDIDSPYGLSSLLICDCAGGGKIKPFPNNSRSGEKDYIVKNNGYFYLYGGRITDEDSVGGDLACGVYNTLEFYMAGGSVDNTEYGVCCGEGSSFIMYGGAIENNAEDGVLLNSPPNIFRMLGGEISANKCGCRVNNSEAIVTVGGKAVINGNTESNLYLSADVEISVADNMFFEEGAYIGITTEVLPVLGAPVNIMSRYAYDYIDYIKYLHSDNPNYYKLICGEDDIMQLAVTHIHSICEGADNCPNDRHIDHSEEIEWTPWEIDNALPTESGYYYLTKDVDLSSPYIVSDGMDIKLCLNGKTVLGASGSNIFIASPSSDVCRLSLCDCVGSGTVTTLNATAAVMNFGNFDLYSGTITDGGSCVDNRGKFTMYGGIIENARDYGVTNSKGGTFDMYGGNVWTNYIGVNNCGGTFVMTGGRIVGNMTFGVYSDKDADSGVGGFTMLGGEIIDCGYGVYVNGSSFTVGKTAVIKDNGYAYGEYLKKTNVYLTRNAVITVSTADELQAGAYIGVTVTSDNPPIEGSPINITGKNLKDYSKYFHSDNPDYGIINSEDNIVQLTVHDDVHTLEIHYYESPSCTESGNEEYWQCIYCGKIFADDNGETELDGIPEIEATGHEWGWWEIIVEPTETARGEAERFCDNDSTHVDIVKLPVLTDKSVWKLVEEIKPTCQFEGFREYTSEYGNVTVTLKKLSHSYEEGKWYCDDEEHWQQCENCEEEVPYTRNTHKWDEGKITAYPTVDKEGVMTYTCEICGHTRTEEIDKETEPTGSGSDTKPSDSGDTEPSDSSDTEPTGSGSEPSDTGDTEPTGSGNEPEPSDTGDTEPTGSGSEPEPSDTGDTEPTGSGSNTEPSDSSDTEPTGSDTEPSDTSEEPPVTPDSSEPSPSVPDDNGGDYYVPESTASSTAQTTSAPAETAPFIQLIDEKTGVKVEFAEGTVKSGAVLNVVKVDETDTSAVFDITLLLNGTVIQPDGTLVITIKIPADLNGDTYYVYRAEIDGSYTDMEATYADGAVTFKTGHLSKYVISTVRLNAAAASDDTENTDPAETTQTADSGTAPPEIIINGEGSGSDNTSNAAEDSALNTGVGSYTVIFLAAGITSMAAAMTFTFVGAGIGGMTEGAKNRLYDRLVAWGKRGGKPRAMIALAVIFLLLSFYYGVGKTEED